MFAFRLPYALALSALMASCVGGDTGTEGDRGYCRGRAGQQPLGPEQETPIGTPRALATLAQGEQRNELNYTIWSGDEPEPRTTQAEIELLVDVDSARLVDRKDRGHPEVVCPPQVEFDAVLRLESSDGAFMERLPGLLTMEDSGGGTSGLFLATYTKAEQRGSYPVVDRKGVDSFQVIMHLYAAKWTDDGDGPDWRGQLLFSFRPAPGVEYGSGDVGWW